MKTRIGYGERGKPDDKPRIPAAMCSGDAMVTRERRQHALRQLQWLERELTELLYTPCPLHGTNEEDFETDWHGYAGEAIAAIRASIGSLRAMGIIP